MTNFFNVILDFIRNAFTFLSNIIDSTLNAALLIANIPSFLIYLSGFVPSIIGASIMIVLAVGVVKLILGWGNSQ